MRTTVKNSFIWSLAACLLFAGSAAAAPPADGPNLLQNPGFEAPYVKQCCQTDLTRYLPDTPIGEVQVAHGWLGWWLQPNQDAQHPSAGAKIAWHRPEWREANCGPVCANRVRSGNDAQKYFTFFSVHDAGMYQQVPGITPGTVLRFSIYMQAWSTDNDYGPSNFVQHMGMRVGIDPFGGTDAFSPNIVWSTPFDTFDAWGLYTIEAAAQSNTVTVFTRSTPLYGSQHNDIYLDDASLVAVSPGDNGSGVPVIQPPTPVPGFRYVVQRSDSYYRIALRFGITQSALIAANPSANPNILDIGAVLFIPGVSPSGEPLNPPPAPTLSPSQLPGAFAYVVQLHDNLSRLSLRFGISIARIKQLNGLVSDTIRIGQTLIIAP
jgi:LysM repeat protein